MNDHYFVTQEQVLNDVWTVQIEWNIMQNVLNTHASAVHAMSTTSRNENTRISSYQPAIYYNPSK